MSKRTIYCIRHGRPGLRYSHTPWRWISAGEMNRLFDAYDLAGLDPEWNPAQLNNLQAATAPERWQELKGAFARSSDLPRAFETALLYTNRPAKSIPVNALFRETPLARFRMTGLRLPTVFLLTLARLGWYSGWLECAETRAATFGRVQAAADRLEADADEHGRVALYSHGFFLWLLGRELRRRGWVSSKTGPYRYLEAASFHRPAGIAVRTKKPIPPQEGSAVASPQ